MPTKIRGLARKVLDIWTWPRWQPTHFHSHFGLAFYTSNTYMKNVTLKYDPLTSPKAPRPITTSGSKSSFPSRVRLRRRNSVSFDAWFFLFSFFSSSDFEAKSSTFIKEVNQSTTPSGYENDSSQEQTTAINGNFQMFAYSFSGFVSDNFPQTISWWFNYLLNHILIMTIPVIKTRNNKNCYKTVYNIADYFIFKGYPKPAGNTRGSFDPIEVWFSIEFGVKEGFGCNSKWSNLI